jgi:hypothetical protein
VVLVVRQKRLEALALETTEPAVVLQASEHLSEEAVAFSDRPEARLPAGPQVVAQLSPFLIFMA